MWRDARGSSGWKNLKGLLRAFRSKDARPIALRIGVMQLPLIAAAIAIGRWWLYPLLWLGPWMTSWRVINRLRSIAEHGGMTRSKDRRQTTHHVRQTWLARFWMVPLNTGWHLAHHVDMGVPWRNLPKLHAELEAAGYVTPELTYPSYRALWRALRSRPDRPELKARPPPDRPGGSCRARAPRRRRGSSRGGARGSMRLKSRSANHCAFFWHGVAHAEISARTSPTRSWVPGRIVAQSIPLTVMFSPAAPGSMG